MSTNTNLKASESNILIGLGTYTHTVTTTGMYFMASKSTVNSGSTLSVTISQSGSTTASGTSLASTTSRRTVDIQNVFNCVSGDVLTIVLTSSSPIDNQLNDGVKTIVTLHAGTS